MILPEEYASFHKSIDHPVPGNMHATDSNGNTPLVLAQSSLQTPPYIVRLLEFYCEKKEAVDFKMISTLPPDCIKENYDIKEKDTKEISIPSSIGSSSFNFFQEESNEELERAKQLSLELF